MSLSKVKKYREHSKNSPNNQFLDQKMKLEEEQKKEDIMKNALNYTSTLAKKKKPQTQLSHLKLGVATINSARSTSTTTTIPSNNSGTRASIPPKTKKPTVAGKVSE